eukprot:403370650
MGWTQIDFNHREEILHMLKDKNKIILPVDPLISRVDLSLTTIYREVCLKVTTLVNSQGIGPVQRQQQIQNRQVNQDQQQIQRDFQHQDQQDGQVQQNQNLYNLVNEFLDFRRHFSWIKFVRSLFCLLIIGSAYYFYTKKNIPEDVRIVLIGSFGSGKSALGNSFLGFDAFETGYSSGALTTQAVEAKSTFLGEQNGKPIYIIDTQGHDDQVGRDVKHASQFIHLLRQKDYINCFVYVINSESPRMNDLTWQRIKYYNSTFTNFWQNLVIVVSRWHFNLEAQRIRDINGLNEQKYKQHLIQTFKDNGFDVKDLDVFYIDVFYNPTSQYQYNKFVNETTRFIDKVSNMVQSNFLENDKYMQLSQQLYKLEIIEIERKRKIEAEQQQKLQKLSELKKELDECEESIWCSMKQKHTDLTEEYQQLLKEIDINSSDAQYEDLQRAINIEKFREIYGMDL